MDLGVEADLLGLGRRTEEVDELEAIEKCAYDGHGPRNCDECAEDFNAKKFTRPLPEESSVVDVNKRGGIGLADKLGFGEQSDSKDAPKATKQVDGSNFEGIVDTELLKKPRGTQVDGSADNTGNKAKIWGHDGTSRGDSNQSDKDGVVHGGEVRTLLHGDEDNDDRKGCGDGREGCIDGRKFDHVKVVVEVFHRPTIESEPPDPQYKYTECAVDIRVRNLLEHSHLESGSFEPSITGPNHDGPGKTGSSADNVYDDTARKINQSHVEQKSVAPSPERDNRVDEPREDEGAEDDGGGVHALNDGTREEGSGNAYEGELKEPVHEACSALASKSRHGEVIVADELVRAVLEAPEGEAVPIQIEYDASDAEVDQILEQCVDDVLPLHISCFQHAEASLHKYNE